MTLANFSFTPENPPLSDGEIQFTVIAAQFYLPDTYKIEDSIAFLKNQGFHIEEKDVIEFIDGHHADNDFSKKGLVVNSQGKACILWHRGYKYIVIKKRAAAGFIPKEAITNNLYQTEWPKKC